MKFPQVWIYEKCFLEKGKYFTIYVKVRLEKTENGELKGEVIDVWKSYDDEPENTMAV